jgi:hypothetical protein
MRNPDFPALNRQGNQDFLFCLNRGFTRISRIFELPTVIIQEEPIWRPAKPVSRKASPLPEPIHTASLAKRKGG